MALRDMRHALGEYAALVCVGNGGGHSIGDCLHANAVQGLDVRALADGRAHGTNGDVLGEVVVGAETDARWKNRWRAWKR